MYYINTSRKFQNRYDISKFMQFGNSVFDIVTSHMVTSVSELSLGGVYVVKGEEARPDLISYSIYGRTFYWWIIMEYNNLFRVEDITEGLQLGYPSLASIEAIYFSLGNLQSEASTA